MASHWFNEFFRGLAAGEIDLDANTIKVKLCMSNTTCDTQNDAVAKLSDITTLDTCDSSGYADATLANKSVTKDDTNDRAKWDADDVTWAALAASTRTIQGALIYKYVDGAGNDIPIRWIEFASAVTPDGSDLTIQWHADGIGYLGGS